MTLDWILDNGLDFGHMDWILDTWTGFWTHGLDFGHFWTGFWTLWTGFWTLLDWILDTFGLDFGHPKIITCSARLEPRDSGYIHVLVSRVSWVSKQSFRPA